ncbi:hypothetical protein L1D14_09260 [Vibrio tubiashii]|uniref:hypothetical protein n=1 Tax=Vibrio tubiashii TaxID=29498 RepID=UPI001EFE1D1D|nr:hypothetical protein [Vibrio tubiashii]MCG9576426.1 hypothetical protein [Vibrio tubiashii]
MSNEREPIGFLPCKKCSSLKSVFQGQGKRARFLYARCGCGLDQRTGDGVQAAFQKHMSKEDAAAALELIKQPKPSETDQTEKKSSKAPWIVGGVLAVVGLMSLRG